MGKKALLVASGLLSAATPFCISTPQVFAATTDPGTATTTTTDSGITLTYIKGTPATINTSSTISPNHIVGPAGYEFLDDSAQATNAIVQKSFSPVDYNNTGSPVPYVWEGSVEVSASGSLGGGRGPINASLGSNADTSVSETYTYEATVSIPAHGYGWYEFGYAHSQWYGDYAYVDDYGNITSNEWITVNSPRYNEVVDATSMSSPSNP